MHCKAPHRIEFVSELPKTATGKVQRFRLRHYELQQAQPSEETWRKRYADEVHLWSAERWAKTGGLRLCRRTTV